MLRPNTRWPLVLTAGALVSLAACGERGRDGATARSAARSATATASGATTSSAATPATASASTAAAASASPSAAPKHDRVVSISSAEMAKFNGIAMGLSFPHPPGWVGGQLDGDSIAHTSSPPGGPRYVGVWSYKEKTHDFATLEKLVTKKNPDVEYGGEDKLTLAGASRVAIVGTQGTSLAATATCSVMIPGPSSASGGFIVSLTGGRSENGKPKCAAIAKQRGLDLIVRELRIDTSGGD